MGHRSQQDLLGRWVTDPADTEALKRFGSVTIEFCSDGRLVYTAHQQGVDQVILLTYRVEGGVLLTNQPSHPREEETVYSISDEGKLCLLFGGVESVYVREM